MYKLFLISLCVSGCFSDAEREKRLQEGVEIMCMPNGVQYYYWHVGYGRIFAPVFNRETGRPEVCSYKRYSEFDKKEYNRYTEHLEEKAERCDKQFRNCADFLHECQAKSQHQVAPQTQVEPFKVKRIKLIMTPPVDWSWLEYYVTRLHNRRW